MTMMITAPVLKSSLISCLFFTVPAIVVVLDSGLEVKVEEDLDEFFSFQRSD